jgi:hypothetical protein
MEDYARQQESGLTVTQWCQDNGILPKTFYYRLKVLREEACSLMKLDTNKNETKTTPEFVKVDLSHSAGRASGINIKIEGAEISISPDASNEHVRMVLEAIAHA